MTLDLSRVSARHFASLAPAARQRRDNRIADARVQVEAALAGQIQQQFPDMKRDDALQWAAQIIRRGEG